MHKSLVPFIFCTLLLFACQNRPRKIDVVSSNGLSKTRLGRSGYFVKHPGTMQLSVDEFHRNGEDSSFVFCKADSLPPYSNTFAIGLKASDSAHAIGFDLPVIEVVQSEVLGTAVNWNVRKSDKGFFVVDARLKDLQFVGTSSTKTGIDSMVALMSSLSSQ